MPVRLIANGRDKAPAPSVALHRLEIDPGCILLHRVTDGGRRSSAVADEESKQSLLLKSATLFDSPLLLRRKADVISGVGTCESNKPASFISPFHYADDVILFSIVDCPSSIARR